MVRQFITFSIAVVMLTACQQVPTESLADSSPDPASAPAVTGPITEDGPIAREQVQLAIDPEDEAVAIEVAEPIEPQGTDSQTTGVQTAGVQDLWQRIAAGLNLDHSLDQPRVRAELDWYRRNPAYLDRVATRASRHLYHIVEAVEARGLPMEIALLPIVESAFDPFAYSHGRASGLWQFIPGTARRFKLDIGYWYDGRRDVPEATRAALDYLEILHAFLGDDWLLALAAYNSGEGNVRYSVRKNERLGRPTDFWSLDLLPETEGYVPRLLAISALVKEPDRYGITLKPIVNEPYWEVAETGGQIDLAKAAELAGISTEELYLLNPAYNKWSTRPEGPHRLLVPVGKAAAFESAVAALPVNERLKWLRHKIRSGESLGVIASRYGTTIDTLKVANRLTSNLIRAGDTLLIPTASQPTTAYDLSDEERLKSRQAYLENKTGIEPTRYVVRSGDSFWRLSRRYGVSMREIARWNGLGTTDTLFPGQELKLFIPQGAKLATVSAPVHEGIIRKINYRVRRGESLAMIANRFNVALDEVKRWNQKVASQKYLQPGDRVTLYVDVTDTD